MPGRFHLGLLLLGLSVFSDLRAVELLNVTAINTDERYEVEVELIATLPEIFVREVLGNPDRFVQVNPASIEVHHLPSKYAGVQRFRDRTRSCVLFYCVDYQNTLDMRIHENRDIVLTVDPSESAFKYGVFTWRTKVIDRYHTRIVFHSESEPGFWVPATFLLTSRVKEDVEEMLQRMECQYHQDKTCDELNQIVDSTSDQ